MNATANSGSRVFRSVVSILLFVVVCVGLYYLYNFLYGDKASLTSVSILSGTPKMTDANLAVVTGSSDKAVAVTDLTGVMDGGQYSTSFWAYISSTRGFTGTPSGLAHLMEISDTNRFSSTISEKGKTLLFVGLNPINGTLVVRQNSPNDDMIDNSVATSTSSAYSVDNLITNYNVGTTYTINDKCDITNGIEYQRWVLVTTVGNGKTLDVYIDGKLARSCVYKGNYALSNSSGKGKAVFGYNNGDKLKGFFSNGKFYNYAMTPDEIWALYMAGPGEPPSISNFFSNLFSINIEFKSSSDVKAPDT